MAPPASSTTPRRLFLHERATVRRASRVGKWDAAVCPGESRSRAGGPRTPAALPLRCSVPQKRPRPEQGYAGLPRTIGFVAVPITPNG